MQTRIYNKKEVATFRSTKAVFGGLSNMAAGYSIFVNGIFIPSSEALYQACKFPDYPSIQHDIINQKSPMTAKSISRKHNALARSDWDDIRLNVMEWCLKIKLSQNWELFSKILLSTGNKPIVEYTREDKIWGATDIGNNKLEGVNALGRLLMKLREQHVKPNDLFHCVPPLEIPNFLLYENEIDWVCDGTNGIFDLGIEEVEHEHIFA